MADEQETIAAAPTPEAQPAPVEQPEAAPEPENLQAAEDEAETALEPVDDFEEFEWNGKPIKGPKGLKDGVLMHKDYTQKTQGLSAERKQLADAKVQLAERTKFAEETLDMRAEQKAVRAQLERYRQVNWQQYAGQDPVAAQQHYMTFQQLEGEDRRLGGEIDKRVKEQSEAAQRDSETDFAKRAQETEKFARENIKGWTPELGKQVLEFALEQGISQDALRANMNPQIYQILHLARLGSQVLNKPATTKPAQPAPVPTVTVSARGNAPVRKSLADMSMDEYVATRKKQMAARG